MGAFEPVHIPVMADEVLAWLAVKPDGHYVDCTAGLGGHASLIAARCGAGRLIALDRDPAAVALASTKLARYPHASVHHANYGDLESVLDGLGVATVDGVLIDAGVSSMQLDDGTRGFSFQDDGPLDMRMDTSKGPTAAAYLTSVTREELVELLRRFGDVGPAKRIADAIVRRRERAALATTGDLAAAVSEALHFVQGTPDEVRTVFQAVRMALNEELSSLESGLRAAARRLRPGGRLVGISFHSGEDRVVKNLFRDLSRRQRELHPDGRVRRVTQPMVKLLTPKPVTPGAAEVAVNPRSKSARLRAVERLAAPSDP